MTATVLGTSAVFAAPPGKVESSILLYSETDRVKAAEAVTGVKWNFEGDRVLGIKLTYDGLTGASPNGAVPSNSIQTFTRPSGKGQYTVQPGEVPLDDTFHDSRFGADASFSQPLNRMTTFNAGVHFSVEYDYLSVGGNVGISRDFNQKNTTLEVAGSFSYDRIKPEGGIPEYFAMMPIAGTEMPRVSGDDTKKIFDAVIGVTQVIDRKTVAQFNYSIGHASGGRALRLTVRSSQAKKHRSRSMPGIRLCIYMKNVPLNAPSRLCFRGLKDILAAVP